jgi:hypothetical protein
MIDTMQDSDKQLEIEQATNCQIIRDLMKYSNQIHEKLSELDDEARQEHYDAVSALIDQNENEGFKSEELPYLKLNSHAKEFNRDMLEIFSGVANFNNKLRKVVETHGIPLNKTSLASDASNTRHTYNPVNYDDYLKLFVQDDDEEIQLHKPKDIEYIDLPLITFNNQNRANFASPSDLVKLVYKEQFSGAEEVRYGYASKLVSYIAKDAENTAQKGKQQNKLYGLDLQECQEYQTYTRLGQDTKLKAILAGAKDSVYFCSKDSTAFIIRAKSTAKNLITIEKKVSFDASEEFEQSSQEFKDFASEEFPFAAYEDYIAVPIKLKEKTSYSIKVIVEKVQGEQIPIDSGLKWLHGSTLRHFGIHLIGGKPILIALDTLGSLFTLRVDQEKMHSKYQAKDPEVHRYGLFVDEYRKRIWVAKKTEGQKLTFEQFRIDENAKLTPIEADTPIEIKPKDLKDSEQVRFGVLSSDDGKVHVFIVMYLLANAIGFAECKQDISQSLKYTEKVLIQNIEPGLADGKVYIGQILVTKKPTAESGDSKEAKSSKPLTENRIAVTFQSKNNKFSGVLQFSLAKQQKMS